MDKGIAGVSGAPDGSSTDGASILAGVLGTLPGVSGAGVCDVDPFRRCFLGQALLVQKKAESMTRVSVRDSLGDFVATFAPHSFADFFARSSVTYVLRFRTSAEVAVPSNGKDSRSVIDGNVIEGLNRFNFATEASYSGKMKFPSDGSTISVE